jgi:hypothetical protein
MRLSGVVLLIAIVAFGMPSSAMADDPPDVFFISMRAPDVEPVPRYISVYADPSDTATQPITGCDGNTYYAGWDDASVFTAALANGNNIELMTGDAGTAPQNAGAVCIIQTAS